MENRQDSITTRDQILQAASGLFMREGIRGASIQEIADKAGVNKAMIYYYFDSKENLFIEVFRKAVRESGLSSISILEEDLPLFDKIRKFIDAFVGRMSERPAVTTFVMNGQNRHPDLLSDVLAEVIEFDSSGLEEQLAEAADGYRIARIDSRQLLVNIISLSLDPVVHRSYYSGLLGMRDRGDYSEFLKERSGVIYDMTISWLTG